MKIRLEPQRTSLRISKSEFERLLTEQKLTSETHFPNGETLAINVLLGDDQSLIYSTGNIAIELPTREIRDHTPSKQGLSFCFQMEDCGAHELVFEVDIKKKPLGSKARR